jgi:SNF2 family DNA or RNA helicase
MSSDLELETQKQGLQHVLLLQEKDNLESLVYCPTSRTARQGRAAVPIRLRSELKPHQLQGLEWLQQHWLSGARGALLADDMGLGKTLQVLAFLLWIRQQQVHEGTRAKPILVAAPPGLLANWADEHITHLEGPGLGVPLRAYGEGLRALRRPDTKGLAELLAGAPVLQTSRLQEAEWVLTTYETVRDYSHSFGRVRWDAIIFDEAQKIKNPCALITEEAKAVASSASFVIAMTGTPVENRLSDLWSLADTCEPGALLDLRRFVLKFDTHRDSSGEEIVKLKDEITHTEFPVNSSPRLMLRRMKWQELRGLPEKHIEHIRCTMPEEQAVPYAQAVKLVRGGAKTQASMLQALHALRSISLHPRPAGADEPDSAFVAASARLSKGFEVLDQIHRVGERALIFLESRALQPIVQGIIQRRYGLNHPPMLINGDVAGDRRKAMVRKFQEGGGFDCMILSPKAGGVGLTLTSANHVIHLTRWWNPAVEDQCTDRIYRIGQEKPVHVHIPMAIHPEIQEYSFDARLDALLETKRDLSRRVLGLAPSATSGEDLSALYSETIGESPA